MITNVIQYLQEAAVKYPQKIAFSDKDRSITFLELDQQARELALRIVSITEGKTNSPIVIYINKSIECIISFMAVIYSGNFYTPLDTTSPIPRLKNICDTLNPICAITKNLDFSKIASNRETPVIDFGAPHPTTIDEKVLEHIFNKSIDTDPLYILFTSGSTGSPKGVIISHRSVIDYTEWAESVFKFTHETIFGNQSPFYFDNSILDIYSTLKNGAEAVIIPGENFIFPVKLITFLNEKKIDTILWVPSSLNFLSSFSGFNEIQLPFLKRILFSAEVMPIKQLNMWREHFPEKLYANLYGPTEITNICTFYIVDREFQEHESLPIGIPCRNTDILILDDEDKLVQSGQSGELCVKGTSLSMGYWNDIEKTNRAFTQNPLNPHYPEKIYRTGDLAKYNERGEIIFIGRKDFQIKHLGQRIELGEIETAAFSFENISQCCVIYDDEKKAIYLFCAPENLDKKRFYSHLKGLLPHYMLPSNIETRKVLPLTPSGKIDRLLISNQLKGAEK